MKWVITGGCGFIGRNLINDLKQDSAHAIRVIDNLSVGTLEELKEVIPVTEGPIPSDWQTGKAQFVQGDIMDESLAVEATKGADLIVHLAANTGVGPSVDNPRSDCTTNVIGTLNYLEACRLNNIRRFVFASSGAPIGECTPPIHEELACHPVSPYGASKLAGEGYCSAYFRSFGIETVALRFGNVYGPLSSKKESVVAKFIKKALKGETLGIYGDGKQTRDFIFIGDLVKAIQLAAQKQDVGGEVFQIATNHETTLNQITRILSDVFEKRGISLQIEYGAARTGDVMRNFSDVSKANKHLGWICETSLESGLEKTLEWFMK